ncbi:CD82 antigen-like [Chelonus insularis]|uniref:CD82 antigen-like n=1 Tax=Chelonus insularis TaxID=460826 RepID=UPI00158C0115|nr:CD82 antigen-like [Chelonus insularis]
MKLHKRTVFRAFMCSSNVLFTISGFVLMSLGVILLIDSDRILMSRLLGPDESQLNQPLFYYLAFGFVGLGFIIVITGLFGCWLSCSSHCCVTGLYITALILLLLSEFTLCAVAVFWPDLIGVDVHSTRLVRALQRNYGLPGREQFTAALDLAQTTYSCCGINGSNNYGTSWWRLQEIGRRDLIVPLTCCVLNSTGSDSFLNPVAKDLEACQALNPARHQHARHTQGCLELIEDWVQTQLLILLTIGLSLMFFEICVLSSSLLACRNRKKASKKKNTSGLSSFTSTQALTPHSQFTDTDYDFETGLDKNPRMNIATISRKA